jgi:hypothetical protein
MPTQRIVLAALALAGLVATGCSTPEPGTPVAGEPGPASEPAPEPTLEPTLEPTPEPTTLTSAPSEAPPPVDRPRPIDLTTVDVCQVVAALPLRDYGLDGDRPPLAGDSSLFPGARDCFANGIRNNVSLLVVAVTDQGAQPFAESANVAAKTVTVAAGYPLTVLTPRAPASCLGVLDVHDGQMLYLSYGLGSPNAQPVTPQARLCRTIPAVAAAAVGALG